jgi:hypothetical protein
MKKVFALTLFLAIIVCASSMALVQKCPELDYALSCLEKGNPFLERYNKITGSEIEPLMELGVPYFWGGRDINQLGHVRSSWQDSKYYKIGSYYMYGFDCAGFTQWVLKSAGRGKHPPISEMLSNTYLMKDKYLNFDDCSYQELEQHLKIGDLLAASYAGGRHVMMYIGTLRDFGYIKSTVPKALSPYLRWPLIMHSSSNAFYYAPYKKHIENTYKITKVIPPDGGCMVSLLGVPVSEATSRAKRYDIDSYSYYFNLGGYALTIYDMDNTLSHRWIRWEK